ncbi:MAG: dienelactone hydrolase [Caulobacter sp.]|nr:dienelactone hydrolase [Caulobacter sp.]
MNGLRRGLLRAVAALGIGMSADKVEAAPVQSPVSVDVREDGLVGRFHALPGTQGRPGVLMLNGSDGGIPDERAARDLAAAGYPTLALAYFQDWNGRPAGVPRRLIEIPLEYLFRGIDWLKARPEVRPDRVAIMGQSRGGELALLLGSLRSDVAAVIAYVPSGRLWNGLPAMGDPPGPPRGAWTLNGEPLPFQIAAFDPAKPMRQWFENAVPDAASVIKVERIGGPVLLISTTADTIWPSSVYADEIETRLQGQGFRWPVTNLKFDDASHLLMGFGPGITRMEVPGAGFSFDFGGSPEGAERARDAGWAASKTLLAQLDRGG